MKTRAELFDWLAENCGNLGAITGTDADALVAATCISELWTRTRSPAVALAFGLCVGQMQPKCAWFAFHAVACPGDWSHRVELSKAAQKALQATVGDDGEPQIPNHERFPIAKHEPRSPRRGM